MYYTYVLLNKFQTKTYTGSTSNLEKRLKEHNWGMVLSTKVFKPYEIIHLEKFNSLKKQRGEKSFTNLLLGKDVLK